MIWNRTLLVTSDLNGILLVFSSWIHTAYEHIVHVFWVRRRFWRICCAHEFLFLQKIQKMQRVQAMKASWKGSWPWQLRQEIRFCVLYMGVSKNNGTPKSSILIGFSIINPSFWGTTIFGNIHMVFKSFLKKINNSSNKPLCCAPKKLVENMVLKCLTALKLALHGWGRGSLHHKVSTQPIWGTLVDLDSKIPRTRLSQIITW